MIRIEVYCSNKEEYQSLKRFLALAKRLLPQYADKLMKGKKLIINELALGKLDEPYLNLYTFFGILELGEKTNE